MLKPSIAGTALVTVFGLGIGFVAPAQAQNNDIKFNESILDDSFAAFKEDITETECVVRRIGKFPDYGEKVVGRGARITPEEAAAAYECLKDDMRRGYALSGLRQAGEYLDWQVFSTGPYLSRAHSQRFVSNYANAIAAENYAKFEAVGEMPVGSMMAKDSFVITQSGRAVFGSLGIMEKMPPGFSPETGDWRFTLILPDGRLFGVTREENEAAVEFCADCHRDAGAGQDYLFFMPLANRVTQR